MPLFQVAMSVEPPLRNKEYLSSHSQLSSYRHKLRYGRKLTFKVFAVREACRLWCFGERVVNESRIID